MQIWYHMYGCCPCIHKMHCMSPVSSYLLLHLCHCFTLQVLCHMTTCMSPVWCYPFFYVLLWYTSRFLWQVSYIAVPLWLLQSGVAGYAEGTLQILYCAVDHVGAAAAYPCSYSQLAVATELLCYVRPIHTRSQSEEFGCVFITFLASWQWHQQVFYWIEWTLREDMLVNL